jgi:hypothetical protein
MSDGENSPHDKAHLLALNAALRAENENLSSTFRILRCEGESRYESFQEASWN